MCLISNYPVLHKGIVGEGRESTLNPKPYMRTQGSLGTGREHAARNAAAGSICCLSTTSPLRELCRCQGRGPRRLNKDSEYFMSLYVNGFVGEYYN